MGLASSTAAVCGAKNAGSIPAVAVSATNSAATWTTQAASCCSTAWASAGPPSGATRQPMMQAAEPASINHDAPDRSACRTVSPISQRSACHTASRVA